MLRDSVNATLQRADSYRSRAARTIRKAAISDPFNYASNSAAPSPSEAMSSASGYAAVAERSQCHEQLHHFSDWVYVAIRPPAVRLAAQEVRVGWKDTEVSANAPRRSKAAEGDEAIEFIDVHPLLESMEDPNPLMTQWHLLWFYAVSIQLTGKAYWWLTTGEGGKLEIWPLPASWVAPSHEVGLNNKWIVQPRGGVRQFEVRNEDMLWFHFPHPIDPLLSHSPLQATAKPVTIDESIQASQLARYRHGIRPEVIVTAGRLPGPGGAQGPRPVLTPKQRGQLRSTIRAAMSGVLQHGDVAIVDGLIESITPWMNTPAEMDWVNSGEMIKSRIMQTIGTNPISAGQVEGANRASSWVADQNLCNNVVNPMIIMANQVMTRRFRGKYPTPAGKKLTVRIPICKPHDPELELAQRQFLAQNKALNKNEMRGFVGLSDMPGGNKYESPPVPKPPNLAPTDRNDIPPVVEQPIKQQSYDEGFAAAVEFIRKYIKVA